MDFSIPGVPVGHEAARGRAARQQAHQRKIQVDFQRPLPLPQHAVIVTLLAGRRCLRHALLRLLLLRLRL